MTTRGLEVVVYATTNEGTMNLAARLYPETRNVTQLLQHMVALARGTTGVQFEVEMSPESHVGEVAVVVDGKRVAVTRRIKAHEIVAWFEGFMSGWLASENLKAAKQAASEPATAPTPLVAGGRLDDPAKHLTAEQLGVPGYFDHPVTNREFIGIVAVTAVVALMPVALLIGACFMRDWMWGGGS